jgi:serine/threonine protein kinase/predicted Zn-dependent protease
MGQAASDRLAQADSILRDALDLPAEERARIVRERCGSDAALGDSLIRLIANFDQLGTFLEQPAFPLPAARREISPGTTLGGRFRVVSLVGRGGMGEVYRAEDLDLGVEVALKTVRHGLLADESARTRFRAEIRLARQISHPNICRIFDLFSDRLGSENLLFFTMEYLEGETLADRLARGVPGREDVVRLASAIAEGLAAAHKEGIVHGDLKPANIMIAAGRNSAERIVITDFGLATSVEAGVNTPNEQIAGSPDYMAPEQFLGENPTPATDVYAFGVIVYEMTAGQRPFPRESLIRAALRRVSQDPPPLRSLAPDAPATWEAALERALARDPHARYQSAHAFVERLQPAGGPRIRRRNLLVGGVAGICVAASLAIFRFTRWDRSGVVDPVLLIMPCSFSPNDNRSASLARAADVLLRSQFSQSAHVRLLRPEQIETAWRLIGAAGPPDLTAADPRTARHVALRAKVARETPFVLFGSIARAGDRYALLLSLENVGGSPAFPMETKSWQFDFGGEGDLSGACLKAAKWARKTIGESERTVEATSRRPEELTTPEWQALQEYEMGDAAWKRNETERAILHLKTAIAIDPEFASAEARLADLLVACGQVDEGYLHWSAAARLLERRNLTDRESLSIRGRFALDVGLLAQAEDIFSRYALEFPEDGLPFFYKADAVARQGKPEQAEHLLDQAVQKNPQSPVFLLHRSAHFLEVGDIEKAERDWRASAKLARGDWVDQFAAAMALERGRFDEAWSALSRLRTNGSPGFQSRGFALGACFRAEQGKWAEAERMLNDGIAFDRTNGQPRRSIEQKQRLLAEAYLTQNKRAEAARVCHAALDGVSGAEMQMRLGSVLARAGDVERARRCLRSDVPDWPYYQVWMKALEGEIALANGQPRRAVELMKQSVQPAFLRIWPGQLARASLAAQDFGTAGACLINLLTHPGIYWLDAEQNSPGMLRYAVSGVRRLGKWPDLNGRIEFFRALLEG